MFNNILIIVVKMAVQKHSHYDKFVWDLLDDSVQYAYNSNSKIYMMMELESNNEYYGLILEPNFTGCVTNYVYKSLVDMVNERNAETKPEWNFNSDSEFESIMTFFLNEGWNKYQITEEDMALIEEQGIIDSEDLDEDTIGTETAYTLFFID
jgi:hypothetical protein